MERVEIISTETIKPSSPTPQHLRNYKLSLIDQLLPKIYFSLVFFYSGDRAVENVEKFLQLKKSLSETLTRFYPLAGRIKDSDTIDCNDEGVDFVEARVRVPILEFVREFDAMALNQLVPCTMLKPKSGNDVILAVQINFYECGGLAVGVGISHAVADAASLTTLINNWAATARGVGETFSPTFGASLHFPPRELGPVPGELVATGKNLKGKTFVFDASKLAELKARVTKNSPLAQPTTVEAVSVLIWRCFIRVQRKVRSYGAFVAQHAVSLRQRMVPPLPENFFGNLLVPTFTPGILESEYNEDNADFCLLGQLKDAFKRINSGFIEELKGPNGIDKAKEALKAILENYSEVGIGLCNFSSWRRFPVYEADFGWGKPIWVGLVPIPFPCAVVLFPTRSGEGVEATVIMEEEEMAELVQDQELLSFVSTSNIARYC